MQEPPLHAEQARAPAQDWAVLARRHALLSAEHSSLQATLDAIYQSRGWRLLCCCRHAVRVLLPPGSRRRWLAYACLRAGWAAWAVLASPPDRKVSWVPWVTRLAHVPKRTGGASVPTERRFRVVYIGHIAAQDAASLRYRAHNVIEALTLQGVEAMFVPEEDAAARLADVLAHDLIVFVRRSWNPTIKALVQIAQQAEIPVVFDLDDFLFDPWILPYIDSARGASAADALHGIKDFRTTLEFCDYYTGTTRFLVEKVAALNKPGWVIRNGLNVTQLDLCRALLERPPQAPADGAVRIGYFSGTMTHQLDFRVAYPALVRILREFEQVRLIVVGELDLHLFPGLDPFHGQIEQRPCVDWRDLPAVIASVAINIVPLEINPFTEAKSNLKYYEAAALKVPTIASPTEVFVSSIRHGGTGMLAASDEDWYQALKLLVTDAALRRRLGAQAHAHALRDFVPSVIADEALSVYRQILRAHRERRGVPPDALTVVVLMSEPEASSTAAVAVLRLAEELAQAGSAVSVCVLAGKRFASVADLDAFVTAAVGAHRFAVQYGGDVPCCDVLVVADSRSAQVAADFRHRAYRVFDLCHVTDLRERHGAGRHALRLLRAAVIAGKAGEAAGQGRVA